MEPWMVILGIIMPGVAALALLAAAAYHREDEE